jgi:hypothetical protein
MRNYTRNSPEAVSRLVAMAMITDAEVDDRELDALERMDFYGSVGINKWAFGDVLADFCDDLKRKADRNGRIRLLDQRYLDHALSEIDDPLLRAKTVALIANLVKSDGQVVKQEAAFFAYLLRRWDYSAESDDTTTLH